MADVAHMAGVKTRTIQFWTMNNVLICDPETRHGGPGVKRRYELSECAVAALVAIFAELSVPVGRLSEGAAFFRETINAEEYGDSVHRQKTVEAYRGYQISTYQAQVEAGIDLEIEERPLTDKETEIVRKSGVAEEALWRIEAWNNIWSAIEKKDKYFIVIGMDSANSARKWWWLHCHLALEIEKDPYLLPQAFPEFWDAMFTVNATNLFKRFP